MQGGGGDTAESCGIVQSAPAPLYSFLAYLHSQVQITIPIPIPFPSLAAGIGM